MDADDSVACELLLLRGVDAKKDAEKQKLLDSEKEGLYVWQ